MNTTTGCRAEDGGWLKPLFRLFSVRGGYERLKTEFLFLFPFLCPRHRKVFVLTTIC